MIHKLNYKIKNFLLAITVSIVTFFAFCIYLIFIGIPKTQARNYYNKAIIAIEFGARDEAITYLSTALKYWEENYIKQKLLEITE
ncbi:MAG: hypothetical protein KatS3mg085_254 [Candidatus Dojkabacteria bacterium]|nr:MAG: hypothetical protein KatS3mg085_254 [Candidatus Dojkabacteria bacterium]GIV45080.1 MAG: hypothetical protein KatS3mg035_2203 [Bacteroidia bacterium]GIV45085.1 MAG: hypothetical protein KatS3mg035_2208 [Bacteroidia bacterium]